MADSENMVNIKKISDKHNLPLTDPFNPNLLICKLRFLIGLSPFYGSSLLIVNK